MDPMSFKTFSFTFSTSQFALFKIAEKNMDCLSASNLFSHTGVAFTFGDQGISHQLDSAMQEDDSADIRYTESVNTSVMETSSNSISKSGSKSIGYEELEMKEQR